MADTARHFLVRRDAGTHRSGKGRELSSRQEGARPPRKLIVDYLLHGTTGSEAECLALIKATWEPPGWNTGYKIGWMVVREPSDVVQAQTPGHYTLVTQQEAEGRRAIYVTLPCFPHTAVGAGPVPAEVRQR
jgi:hypothetical protein